MFSTMKLLLTESRSLMLVSTGNTNTCRISWNCPLGRVTVLFDNGNLSLSHTIRSSVGFDALFIRKAKNFYSTFVRWRTLEFLLRSCRCMTLLAACLDPTK